MSFQSGGHGSTPNDDGFYLPADGCRLARLWLPWPAQPALQEPIAALVRAVAEFTNVSLTCTARDETAARAKVGTAAEVIVLGHASARLRDIGPTFLVDGKGGAAAVDWVFNGWGGRALCADADRDFAHALLGLAEVRRFRAPLTLEAGCVVADGQDTVIGLAPAVFDEARNSHLSRLEAFAIFQQWLGASRVIWIEDAHPADSLGTDLRALAAFVAPGRVVASKASDEHTYAQALARVRTDLAVRDGRGNRLEIIDLPAPAACGLPLSYTNFLVVNGGVFVPAYGVAQDDEARAILAEAFPGRDIRLIPALEFARAGLTLTSVGLPQPARLLERERASLLPRSAWAQPVPDIDGLLQKYIDLAARE